MTIRNLLTAAVALPTALSATRVFAQAGPAPVPVPAVVGVPSLVDDLQTLVDQQKYADASRLATKLLAIHGQAAAGISRFRVLMLRGDALAGINATSSAINAWKAALKETNDPREIAISRWTVELFTRAKGTTFSPKIAGAGVPPRTLNLLDRAERKIAFGEMLNDDLTTLGPKIHLATVSLQLGDIIPVLAKVEELQELDFVANDSNSTTARVAGDMLDHSRNLLSSTLKGMWTRIGDIDTAANTPSTGNRQVMVNGQLINQPITIKPGLTFDNRNELVGMIDTANRISGITNLFAPLAQTDKDWMQIKNDADRVVGRASDLLSFNFAAVNQAANSADYSNQGGFGGGNILPVPGLYGGYSLGGLGGYSQSSRGRGRNREPTEAEIAASELTPLSPVLTPQGPTASGVPTYSEAFPVVPAKPTVPPTPIPPPMKSAKPVGPTRGTPIKGTPPGVQAAVAAVADCPNSRAQSAAIF